jgi:hypothetical protein
MALKLRRGLSSDRTTVTPAEGELLYTTDTKLVYVGDGSTAGGNVISGGGGGGTGPTYNLAPRTVVGVNRAGIQLGTNDNSVTDTVTLIGAKGVSVSVFDENSLSVDGGINTGNAGEIPFYQTTGQELTSSGPALGWDRTTGQLLVGDNTNTGQVRVYSVGPGLSSFVAGSWHNSGTNVNNIQLQRARGTGLVPLTVQDTDRIYDIRFTGWDGAANQASSAIRGEVNGTVASGIVPGRLRFITASAAGTLSTCLIMNSDQSSTFFGHVTINGQREIRLSDVDNSNYVGFKSSATVASNVIWTLPAADGASGQALTTNGTGTLSWTSVSGGSGGSSRTSVSGPTGVIANGAKADITISGYKGYILYKIETSAAAWVRIYTDVPSRTSDASRLEGADPLPGSGVIAEVITTGSQAVLISPGAIGFNGESSPSSNIYLAVTNKSGGSTSITVTLTVLQIEV